MHWPQRYSPQSNWGQSLSYSIESDADPYWRAGGGPTSFEDICLAMENLIQEGKIRGWGLCNDNAYGLIAADTVVGIFLEPPLLRPPFLRIRVTLRSVAVTVAGGMFVGGNECLEVQTPYIPVDIPLRLVDIFLPTFL
mmetsp:Transcript_23411/g.23824  ORF Transcript_23411/g.23824 Transcript_23411/m.23824 type:complete len:138 (+) Transcript_23411:87-500(+)